MSFSSDNALAKFYENLYINLNEWDNVLTAPDKQFKDWDIVIRSGDKSKTAEIKSDRNVVNTGNLSIELFSFVVSKDGKRIEESGLMATKAELFVVFAHNTYEWWVIPTSWLKNYVVRHRPTGAGWFGDKIATVNIPIRNQMAEAQIEHYIPPTREIPSFTEGKAYNFLYRKDVFNKYKMPNWNTIIPDVNDYMKEGVDLSELGMNMKKHLVVVKYIDCPNSRADVVYLLSPDDEDFNKVKDVEYDGHKDIPGLYRINPEVGEEEEETYRESQLDIKRGK